MLFSEISRIIGNYLYYFALILCFPLGIAIYFQFVADPDLHPQPHSSLEFLTTIFITLGVATLLRYMGKKATGTIYRRESILLVTLIWLVTCLISAVPFVLTGTLKNPIDACFESMSGLTTTGSSMISAKKYDINNNEIPIEIKNVHVPENIYHYYGTVKPVLDPKTGELYEGLEAVSKAILLWRSFLQWLGGMGIVVLFLTVLPALGVGGKFLYQTEMPGPVKDAISPRIKETASLLWKLYIGLTFLEIILLLWTNPNMPFFDSVCISFSNLSTGGFALHASSIASYQSAATEWIVILFMVLGSINFGLYFHIIRLKFYKIYGPDFFLFMLSIILGSAIVTFYLVGTNDYQLDSIGSPYSLANSIRTGAFQAVSAQTSTGFFTANYDLWPFPSQMFMLLSMFFGGMAGATCGGLKSTRFYLLYKILVYRIESIFRPDAVRKLMFAKAEIGPSGASTILSFFCVALLITVTGTVIYVLTGIDPETSLGLMGCFVNNIGLSFRAAGPLDSINFLSPFAKICSIFFMLLGRLEFFALILLFFPGFWKSK